MQNGKVRGKKIEGSWLGVLHSYYIFVC